jgi:uncharacterized protein (TIGR02246 family)
MRSLRSLILAAVGIFALNVQLSGAVAASGENREADHTALRALRDKVATALNQQDAKTLASCFAKEFAFTAVNQTVVTNEAQIQALFDSMFRGDKALLTGFKTEPKADILTRFVDTNTGVCYGSTKDTYTMKSGQVVEMNVRWSATVVKEDGQWKVALAHAGTDFLDNPVLEKVAAASKRLTLLAAIGGLLIGLVVGWMIKRKPKVA